MVWTTVKSRESWEEVCSRVFAQLSVTDASSPFASSIDHRTIGNVSFTRVRTGTGEVRRRPVDVDVAPSDVALFSFHLRGTGIVAQDGNTSNVGAGTGVLYHADAPYTLSYPSASQLLIVRVPRTALGVSSRTLASLAARSSRITQCAGLLNLARLAVSLTADSAVPENPDRTARVTIELLSNALRFLAELPIPRRSKEELAIAFRQTISARLDDPELNVAALASAQAVSVRTVHEVFSHLETTPARAIREARLHRAVQLLESTDLRIVDIAATAGFGDVTTFTRMFRREFDASPGGYRTQRRAAATHDAR